MRPKGLDLKLLEIANQRMTVFPDDFKKAYYALSMGYEGESEVDQVAEARQDGSFIYISDYRFAYHGENQIDSLLITKSREIYMIEIKNYSKQLYFHQGVWSDEKGPLSKDFFHQMDETKTKLNAMLHGQFSQFELKPVLVFMNHETYPKIDGVPNYPVLYHYQLPSWFEEQRQKTGSTGSEINNLYLYLKRFAIDNHYYTNYKCWEVKSHYRTGIVCPRCGKFDIGQTKRHYYCETGHREGKSEAIMRTVDEYALLFWNRDLKNKDIKTFCGDLVNKYTLCRILNREYQHFSSTQRGVYINPYRPG